MIMLFMAAYLYELTDRRAVCVRWMMAVRCPPPPLPPMLQLHAVVGVCAETAHAAETNFSVESGQTCI